MEVGLKMWHPRRSRPSPRTAPRAPQPKALSRTRCVRASIASALAKFEREARKEAQSADRVALRLDGLEMYALIMSLVTGDAINAIELVRADQLADLAPPLRWAYAASAPPTAPSGLYAIIIFALCSMYAKTALGYHRDEAMVIFMHDTAAYRQRAFYAFLASMSSFSVTILVVRLSNFPGRLGELVVLCGLGTVGCWHRDVGHLLEAATPIFTDPKGSDTGQAALAEDHRHDVPVWRPSSSLNGVLAAKSAAHRIHARLHEKAEARKHACDEGDAGGGARDAPEL
mmetsp:Transcript_27629/g.91410  ORF Transcript_27629/g.91410 Transcript_27629/m.91410 type:complete len:286 (+) Transcript_27629:89-946(+)